MDQLPATVNRRIGRQAITAATRIVRKAARRLVRRGTRPLNDRAFQAGNEGRNRLRLRDTIRMKTWTAPRVKKIYGRVFASNRLGGFHSHVVEYGSYLTGVRHHKSGKSTGVMPAFPFMRPAIDQNRNACRMKMGEILARGLNREWAKLALKAKQKVRVGRRNTGSQSW